MNSNRRVGMRMSIGKDGIKITEISEDSFPYWGPSAIMTAVFMVVCVVSGYFFFHNHPRIENVQSFYNEVMEKPEAFVIPLTYILALSAMLADKKLVFWPAFSVGCVWGALSLFNVVTFDVASYIFFYCCAIILLFIFGLLNRI